MLFVVTTDVKGGADKARADILKIKGKKELDHLPPTDALHNTAIQCNQ